ncbi:OLC1v1036043C5 [Oldenlandia corymbosa var. corymbosa]|nr:OLC1v1036043C5 [Oldenlandia corymbosa var. corymbosa]
MLMHSLMPGAIEGAISFASDIAAPDFSCDSVLGGYMNFVSIREIRSDVSSSVNHSDSGLRISSSSTMSGNSNPLHVYRRRKLQPISDGICPKQVVINAQMGGGCNFSSRSDEAETEELGVSLETEMENIVPPVKLPSKHIVDGCASLSGSSDECVHREDPCSGKVLRNRKKIVSDVCGVDDSFSSSKFNLDVVAVTFKTDVEDTAQCSSSGVLLSERSWDSMSGKDFCIAILESRGLLEEASPSHHLSSADNVTTSWSVQKCKVCDCSEASQNMLICDSCDDAFHAKCCNPRIKRIPHNEWFCYPCMIKKHKLLKEKSTNSSLDVSNGSNGCRISELGPLESMLKDIEPPKFTVRIGHKFQAEVPDWDPSTTDDYDPEAEPEEMDCSDYLNLNYQEPTKTNRLSSIGNWVQCQEVIEGIGQHADGTTCGKWRRAPLFEVQTDNWDCFRAVLWDPAHADCAVPQELPTEEVLRQLKYIEMVCHVSFQFHYHCNRLKFYNISMTSVFCGHKKSNSFPFLISALSICSVNKFAFLARFA